MPDWRYRGHNVPADMRGRSRLINIQPYRSFRAGCRSGRTNAFPWSWSITARKKNEGCGGMQRASGDVKENDRRLCNFPATDEFCDFAHRADWQNWNRSSSKIFWSPIDNSLSDKANEVFGLIIPRFSVARSDRGNTPWEVDYAN